MPQGEDALGCALRELREETGIIAKELTEIGRVTSRDTIFVEFLCVTDVEKDRVTLQEGEITAFQWVTKNALLSMKKEELATKRMQKFIDKWE